MSDFFQIPLSNLVVPPQEKLHTIIEIVRQVIFYLSYRKWSWGYNVKPSADPAQADHNYTSVSLSIFCVIINPRFKEYMGICQSMLVESTGFLILGKH